MKVENFEKNQSIELKYRYEIDGYTTYEIYGRNDFFSGKGVICFNNITLNKFKINIKNIDFFESIKIDDNDSDAFIEVKKIDSLGHFNILYQIGGSHEDNFCRLILNTDKIGIKNFLDLK